MSFDQFTNPGTRYFRLIKQLFRYGCVGILSTLIHFCIACLTAAFITGSLFFSNLIGFLVAYIWSYYAQSRFVFRAGLSVQKGARFFMVQAAALVLSVQVAGLAETVSVFLQVFICAILLPVMAFVIHRVWVFADPA